MTNANETLEARRIGKRHMWEFYLRGHFLGRVERVLIGSWAAATPTESALFPTKRAAVDWLNARETARVTAWLKSNNA